MRKCGQRGQTSSYKMNKFWDVMHRVVTTVNNIILYILKLLRVNFKSSHHKKVVTM